jgi:type I restriction enzyme S subunit
MQAEMFLREFAPLAGGPSGIQKLRELVLQLAVRGKLVPQMPAEGDAGELLSKLKKRFQQQNKTSEYPQSSPLFNIPASWRWTTMAGIGRIVGGGTPKSSVAAYFSEPGIPWLTPADLYGFSAKYIAHGRRSISKLGLAESSAQLLPTGSVLFSSRAPIGYSAIAANPLATNQGFKSCVPYLDGMSEFILIYLRASIVEFEARASGTTFMEVSGKVVSGVPFPLPPLAEQKRIVAKVDELMALCDKLETQQAQEIRLKRAAAAAILQNLSDAKTPQETADRWSLLAPRFGELFNDLEAIKGLRGAISDFAVTGSLGTSDPSENALAETETLRNGRAHLGEKKVISRKLASVAPPTPEEKLHVKTSNWDQVRIGEIALSLDYGTSEKAAADSTAGVLVYGMGQIKDGKLTEAGAKFLDRNSDSLPTLFLKRGDILFNRTNSYALVGKAALYEGNDDCRTFASYLIRIKPHHEFIDARFFSLYLNSPLCRQTQIEPEITQQTNQANYNGSKLANIVAPFPPLAEQKRIVAKVDELMSLCDRLEAQVREGERLNAELMASLVHAVTESDPDGGGAVKPARFAKDAPAITKPVQFDRDKPEAPEIKSVLTHSTSVIRTQSAPDMGLSVDTKFQEAVLVAAIVKTFFEAGGEPIGNFRLQKSVYFARRKMGEHVGQMAYLKKAAGPYNPSMKYSGGIAIAKQKNWLRDARGRFGFGHVPGAEIGDAGEWIDTYRYAGPARWVAEHFRYKKNEEWETLATVDYAIEHLNTLGIEPDAAQILQYIASDPEWRPKIEKLGLTEMSAGTAMLEVRALFSADGGDVSV